MSWPVGGTPRDQTRWLTGCAVPPRTQEGACGAVVETALAMGPGALRPPVTYFASLTLSFLIWNLAWYQPPPQVASVKQ